MFVLIFIGFRDYNKFNKKNILTLEYIIIFNKKNNILTLEYNNFNKKNIFNSKE